MLTVDLPPGVLLLHATALGDRAVWAFDLVPAVVGMVVLWALSGLPWKSARIGLVGLAAFGTEVLLVLLR